MVRTNGTREPLLGTRYHGAYTCTNITLSQKQLEIQALRCNRDTSGRCQHRRHHGILQLRFQLDSVRTYVRTRVLIFEIMLLYGHICTIGTLHLSACISSLFWDVVYKYKLWVNIISKTTWIMLCHVVRTYTCTYTCTRGTYVGSVHVLQYLWRRYSTTGRGSEKNA